MSGVTDSIRELRISTESTKEDVRVAVRDTGLGLSADNLETFRTALHDKTRRYGHGTVDLPHHRRRTRRTAMGERKRATGCNVSIRAAAADGIFVIQIDAPLDMSRV
jgi:hypothetical protein